MILQGTEKRKNGRQKKRWEDNKEWTGMDFGSSTRAVENRTGWKGLIAKSFVVPHQPCEVMEWNRVEHTSVKGKSRQNNLNYLSFTKYSLAISRTEAYT